MGAGTGKTKMSIVVIKDRIKLNKRLLVIVPQDLIFNQWIQECSSEKINYGYINQDGLVGRNKDVYICMFQSLANLLPVLPEKFVKSIDEIITDETHHSSAESIRKIYNHFNHCLRFGLTASPYRLDNQPLGEFYTVILQPIKNSEAIEKGFLCEEIIILPEHHREHITDTPEKGKKARAKLLKNREIIGDPETYYREVLNGLPAMVPCKTHEHAGEMKEYFEGRGWAVDYFYEGISGIERNKIIKRIERKETNILLSVGIGIEGMDVPGLYGTVWLRLTQSLQIWIQLNGRAARPNPPEGKKNYVLIDCVGNTLIHGRPSLDREWSLDTDYTPPEKESEDLKMKICPCGVVNSPKNKYCWICNYDFETGLRDGKPVDKNKRKLPEFVDGQLVFLDEEKEGASILETGGPGKDDSEAFRIKSLKNGDMAAGGSSEKGLGTDQDLIELSVSDKQKLLAKSLTGLNIKNKFKKGVNDWL